MWKTLYNFEPQIWPEIISHHMMCQKCCFFLRLQDGVWCNYFWRFSGLFLAEKHRITWWMRPADWSKTTPCSKNTRTDKLPYHNHNDFGLSLQELDIAMCFPNEKKLMAANSMNGMADASVKYHSIYNLSSWVRPKYVACNSWIEKILPP